jgi:hypothetical protein
MLIKAKIVVLIDRTLFNFILGHSFDLIQKRPYSLRLLKGDNIRGEMGDPL